MGKKKGYKRRHPSSDDESQYDSSSDYKDDQDDSDYHSSDEEEQPERNIQKIARNHNSPKHSPSKFAYIQKRRTAGLMKKMWN